MVDTKIRSSILKMNAFGHITRNPFFLVSYHTEIHKKAKNRSSLFFNPDFNIASITLRIYFFFLQLQNLEPIL